MSAPFGEVVVAMVTPFDDDLALDLDAAAALASWLVEQGADGLVLAGTTGEAPTLGDEEKLELFRVVRGAVDVPLVAGTGSYDTAHSVELSRAAAATGVDGLLVVCPYYSKPSQAGIEAHFRAVGAAADLPFLVYDIPGRSARKIDTEVLLRLAHEVPTMAGVKDAAGDPGGSARLVAEAPDDFALYSGDDALTLPLLAVGAVGVIGVAAHWSAREHAEMITAYHAGDHERARRCNARLLDSYDYEVALGAPQAVCAKAMLRTLGLAVGDCRLPIGPTPDGLEDLARVVHQGLKGA
ncbi:MAG: 4-hydroxy-tetrahydrodipicolinate synthase [Acidimicrobiales bacterium]|nr:4-hydroxy-tetrahydrodipicolinate synthase [Acidimicrobiales bacterium]